MGDGSRKWAVEAEDGRWKQKAASGGQKTASRACRGRNLVAETVCGWWGGPKTSLGGPKMSNAA